MRNSEHPAYQRTERKLRRFCGILSNSDKLLREDGYDYDEAAQWWSNEWHRLDALDEAARKDPGELAEFRCEEQRVEAELFKRMDYLLKFLYAHAPDHPWLPPYRLYMALWHQCYGEPIRPLSEADLKPLEKPEELVIAPTIYGVPFERLDAVRLQVGEMKKELPHQGFAALVMFLCGLVYASGYHERHQQPPHHMFEDGLREAAREALEEAVDFSNEPGTGAEAQNHESEPMTVTFSRLFMAIYYVQRNHTTAVFEWLNRRDVTRDLTSLLFAMGVRGFTDHYAREFVGGWLTNPGEALMLLPEKCRLLIAGFGEEG